MPQQCNAIRCKVEISGYYIPFCGKHWVTLPRWLRDRIHTAFVEEGADSIRYKVFMDYAIKSIAANEMVKEI